MHITCMSAISGTQNLLSWHKREPYRTYWQHSDQLNPLIVNRRIGMRLCRILGPNKYPPRPLCVALNQSTNLAYLCTPVQCPSCWDIHQSWTCQCNMLSYLLLITATCCWMSLLVNLKLHIHMFTSFYEVRKAPPLSWKLARNHRGFSSFVREGWGEVFSRVICGVKGTPQGLIPQSVKVGWIGDGSKSTLTSQQHFFLFSRKTVSNQRSCRHFSRNKI